MSATPTNSVLAHAIASCMISDPRAPGPMMPRRMRSLAPRTLDVARVPARPVATLPIKLRRDCIIPLLQGEKSCEYIIISAGCTRVGAVLDFQKCCYRYV